MNEFDFYWEKIRDLNFDEGEGAPYWIKKAEKFNVNPKKDLETIEDFLFNEISICDEADIEKYPIEYFIPKRILNERSFIPMTSSGSVNKKKTVPWSMEAIKENGRHEAKILRLYGVKERINYLFAGPSDPAPFKYIMDALVEEMKGTIYFAPVETRELKRYFAEHPDVAFEMSKIDDMKKLREFISKDPFLKARVDPPLEYTDEILRKEKVEFLGTLLFWLPALEKHESFKNVKYVYIGGMEIPVELYKYWKGKLEADGKKLLTSYGHHRFGVFFDLPGQELTYYPSAPLSFLYVTEKEDPFKLVKYGERGRIRYLSLDKAMLWCQQERDYAERVAPNEYFSWDGVKQIEAKF
jgi:hypothetical protein